MADEERPETAADARRYRAFISYSHADAGQAAKLHRWLETYRIPARLVGTETAHGKVGKRLAPIFRDRAELAAAHSLNAEVERALGQSDALLVLCSPRAAQSHWVDAEVALFRRLYPERPVIAAILEGEPPLCFPPALLDVDGNGVVQEPIAADFRSDQDGKKLARLKIVAGLTGLALDQIIQRDAQRQLRRVIFVTLLALAMTLLMGLMLLIAVHARREADAQRRQAEGLIEFMLTDLRERLNGVGRLDVLDTVNRRAFAYYADQDDLDDLPVDSLERRARVLHAMGEDDQRGGDIKRAIAEFEEAERVTKALLEDSPNDPERIFAHAQSEFWIGYMHFMANYEKKDFSKALPRFEAYLRLARRLVKLEPNNEKYLRELSYAQGNICSTMVTMESTGDRIEECGKALHTMEQVWRLKPDSGSVAIDVANAHAWHADALHLQGRNGEALAEREEQSAIVAGLVRNDPLNVHYQQQLMLARYSMGKLLYQMGEKDKAQALVTRSRAEVGRLIIADPENEEWRQWRIKFDKPLMD